MNPSNPFDPARRRLLAGLAAGGAAAATLAACGDSTGAAAVANPTNPANPGTPATPNPTTDPMPMAPPVGLPDPSATGIDHIVVVMMENRSYDHFFGWLAGGDGVQAGLKFPNVEGKMVESFRLSQDSAYGWQGCNWADPNHGYAAGRVHLNEGKMDGWLLTSGTKDNPVDKFPVGYYTAEDLPFYKGVAEHYTVCDRYFSGILSQTFPNRFYMHSGQTDRNDNALSQCTLPTIWDRLAAKGRTGLYYYNDVPFTALWANRYASITRSYANFVLDAQNGRLPDVSYIDPNFGGSVGEDPGLSMDDHPHADIRDGQDFLNKVYNTLRTSPNWQKTLLIINYDEWGGFYDHVQPPIGPVSDDERMRVGNADGRLGFRVPCVLIGPRARKGVVEHGTYDPNSILNFICWRFGLDGISARAATSANIAHALDFTNAPRTDKPAFSVPTGPFGKPCSESATGRLPLGTSLNSLDAASRSMILHQSEWAAVRLMAMQNGFPVY